MNAAHAAAAAMTGTAAVPRVNGEPVFAEPWQARVFAMALTTVDALGLTWDAFRERLITAIAEDPDRPYYESWTIALERLVAEHLEPSVNVARRPADPSDRVLAREFHHRAYRDVVVRQFGSWDEAEQHRFFAADWDGASFEIVLCDGAPCGYACIEERVADVHVRELVIAPEFQRRGIGTAILRQAMAAASRRNVPVHLATLTANEAVHLYRRLGFVEAGSTPTHVLLRWPPS